MLPRNTDGVKQSALGLAKRAFFELSPWCMCGKNERVGGMKYDLFATKPLCHGQKRAHFEGRRRLDPTRRSPLQSLHSADRVAHLHRAHSAARHVHEATIPDEALRHLEPAAALFPAGVDREGRGDGGGHGRRGRLAEGFLLPPRRQGAKKGRRRLFIQQVDKFYQVPVWIMEVDLCGGHPADHRRLIHRLVIGSP